MNAVPRSAAALTKRGSSSPAVFTTTSMPSSAAAYARSPGSRRSTGRVGACRVAARRQRGVAVRPQFVDDRGADRPVPANIEQRRTVQSVFVEALAGRGALRPGLSVDDATDVTLALLSPETYTLLTVERGWSPDRWRAWAGDALIRQLTDLGN